MANIKSLIPWREKSPSLGHGDFTDLFQNFRREVDRMFDTFSEGFDGERPNAWSSLKPALDVSETEKDLLISAELPGVSEKDVEVMLTGDLITVKGEKKAEHEEKNGGVWYAERRYGSFSRSMRLPFEVTDEKIDARFENGVLVIRIPKPAEAQKAVRRIEVKSA